MPMFSFEGTMTDEHFIALGRVVASFARLEGEVLPTAIHLLLYPDDARITQAISAELSTRARVQLVESLFRILYPNDDITPLRDLLRRIEKLSDERNTFLHSSWGTTVFGVKTASTGKVLRLKTKARGTLKVEVGELDAKAIRRVAADIDAASGELMAFMMGLPDPPAPKTISLTVNVPRKKTS